MPESVEPFLNNWNYLKAELNWLDRVLGLAVARQRKDIKEIDHLTRSRADKATSHWWKGFVSLEGETSYDSPAEMPRRKPNVAATSYQQQMETKIQASRAQGIALGLPCLQAYLHLTLFEKNLVLMALAPEISRRYGRIYNYLQDTEQPASGGLPTVDLILRILCRNDTEWRSARHCLTVSSTLVSHRLLQIEEARPETLLTRVVKLADPLVSYLLADNPDLAVLEALLQGTGDSVDWQPQASVYLNRWTPAPEPDLWATLVLPKTLIQPLQHLCHRVQFAQAINEAWGFEGVADSSIGSVVLLAGASGTGKTTAARAIAQTLQSPLFSADLAKLSPHESLSLLEEISSQTPTVLLLKSAQVWFGRTAVLPSAQKLRWLQHRQRNNCITLLTVERSQAISLQWCKHFNQILEFPLPTLSSRLKLWQQAFPEPLPLVKIDWNWLANLPLTGGEIRAIAREAALFAAAASAKKLSMKHLKQALEMQNAKRNFLSGDR
jgi:hypothetical protein